VPYRQVQAVLAVQEDCFDCLILKMKALQFFKAMGNYSPSNIYVVCLKSKCTDFLFNYLLDLPEITSYLLRSMTLGKLHSGSNVSSTDHSSTGSHFP